MNFKNTVKLKYILGVYDVFDNDLDETGMIVKIVDEIKKSRRSKKNWSSDDFVITTEILKSAFGDRYDEYLMKLNELQIISACENGTYSFDKTKLYKIFDF